MSFSSQTGVVISLWLTSLALAEAGDEAGSSAGPAHVKPFHRWQQTKLRLYWSLPFVAQCQINKSAGEMLFNFLKSEGRVKRNKS